MKPKITRRSVLAASLATTATVGLARRGLGASSAATAPPNILFILADDLGYADLGCYGHTYPTPRIDALSQQGLMLTQAYANSSICSPTRVGLITGRYQERLRVGLDEPLGLTTDVGLPPSHPTLPSLLRKAGYRTSLFGKWHMGSPPKYGPLQSGYEHFVGFYDGFSYYFSRGKDDPSPLIDGSQRLPDHGYLTDVLGERAAREIAASAAARRPFLVSLHFNAPHWPWEAPEDGPNPRSIKNPMDPEGGSLQTYAAMVASLDRNVGRVLDTLEEHGLAENTIVIFTSDNGGERFSNVWPLTGMKGELLEGGIRVPVLMRWPGHIAAGARSEQVMISMDWLPTLLAAAGTTPDPDYPPDGENLLSVLTGKEEPRSRTLFWRYKANSQAAVRDGNWKYLKIAEREHLFDVAADPRERAELKNRHPDVFERLKSAYATWNARMLPYPPDAHSWNVIGATADRY